GRRPTREPDRAPRGAPGVQPHGPASSAVTFCTPRQFRHLEISDEGTIGSEVSMECFIFGAAVPGPVDFVVGSGATFAVFLAALPPVILVVRDALGLATTAPTVPQLRVVEGRKELGRRAAWGSLAAEARRRCPIATSFPSTRIAASVRRCHRGSQWKRQTCHTARVSRVIRVTHRGEERRRD